MNAKTQILAVSIALVGTPLLSAALYTSDFSVDGIGFTHTTNSPPPSSGTASGSNWTISFSQTPSTDATTNSFITSGGSLTAKDWGGAARFETNLIDVSAVSSVDITGLGSGTFNTSSEFFEWFYSIDGATPVTASKATGTFNHTFSNVDVSAGSMLLVGFTFNHDGASDGFNVSSVTVIPEPSTTLLGALGALVLLRRRR